MVYKNLGQLCIERKLLSEEQLNNAIEYQKKTGLLLGAVLVKLGYLTSQDIVFLLSEQRKFLYEHGEVKLAFPDEGEKEILKSPIVILDLITSGINPDLGAEILQVGLLKVSGEKVIDKYSAYIKTSGKIPDSLKLLYKISEHNIKNAVDFKYAAYQITNRIGACPVFCYNIQYAINFIIHYFSEDGIPFIFEEFFDLLTIWRRLHSGPGRGFTSLFNLSKFYQYELSKPYNVYDSLNAVHHIFLKMMTELKTIEILNFKQLGRFQNREFKFYLPKKTEKFDTIKQSIARIKKIKMTYYSPWTKQTSERVIEPHEIIKQGENFYLIAYCHLREEFRWFRLDRIKVFKILDETFIRRNYNREKIQK